jgi:Rieske Fe-S protein
LKAGLLLGAAASLPVRADSHPQRVASLEEFPEVWSHVAFEFHGQPAFVSRVPPPHTALGKKRVLEVSAGVHLLGLLRECTHNGCPVQWSAAPSIEREMVCHCHGSYFRADDGDRIAGMAQAALHALKLEVRDGAVYAVRLEDEGR